MKQMDRRRFMLRTSQAAGGVVAAMLAGDAAQGGPRPAPGGEPGLAIVSDPADLVASAAPVRWALGEVGKTLAARGVRVRRCARLEQVPGRIHCLTAAGLTSPLVRELFGAAAAPRAGAPESCGLASGVAAGHPVLLAAGGDARGLTYALLEVSERIAHAPDPLAALAVEQPVAERPANPIRSVMRLFVSEVEDKPWFNDRGFWERYLSMLAAQRFNRFNLALGIGYDSLGEVSESYFHFAYPFLLSVPGYRVRAAGLPDAERDRNLDMLRFISDAAATHGLHFQLGLWTHGYAWAGNAGVNYTIEGLTPENHAIYCRDALRSLLEACPSIGGVTFRIHGESGIPEATYAFWKSVFEGIVQCGRRIEIDMHAKGIDQEMIQVALATGMPVNVSPKFWAEHMGLPYHQAAIRSLEMPPPGKQDQGFFALSGGSRRFLRYGYGDLMAEDRRYGVLFRIWPGTQRLLLWGDPAMAAAYSRAAGFCGGLGIELFEPLSFKGRKGSGLPGGRDAYAEAPLKPPHGEWEKYLYTYRLWGRLLYNPDANPDAWQPFLRGELGAAAGPAEAALSRASRILPLVTTAHDPSAANNNFWPELYTSMAIVDPARPHPYGDTPAPKTFSHVSPLDPELFSTIDEFVIALLEEHPRVKYSPLEVAHWLDELAVEASRLIDEAQERIGDPKAPAYRRLAVDVALQSGLGRFFARKLRAGILFSLYERSGSREALREALRAYRAARAAWADLAAKAQGVYVRDITFGRVAHLRGHWADRLAAIDQDIADMEKRASPPGAPPAKTIPAAQVERALRLALAFPARPRLRLDHTPPAPFRRVASITVEASSGNDPKTSPIASVTLRYRRVNQAEAFRSEEMQAEGRRFRATVPGSHTDSPYPLQYYFQVHDAAGQVSLYPGLGPDLCGQPYFILRQAR